MVLNTGDTSLGRERTSGHCRVVARGSKAIGRRQPPLHSLVSCLQESMASASLLFLFLVQTGSMEKSYFTVIATEADYFEQGSGSGLHVHSE